LTTTIQLILQSKQIIGALPLGATGQCGLEGVQAGAVAEVLTALFGSISFTDATHQALEFGPRQDANFEAFAEEASWAGVQTKRMNYVTDCGLTLTAPSDMRSFQCSRGGPG
jgi:hypothetical protein